MIILNTNTLNFITKYQLFKNDTIQQMQLQHRLDLVDSFQIRQGMRVLEVGCGQGDTTMALADAVGIHGSITAIDIASPDYGAPFTLGQAAELIKNSSLGERIQFRFETNFMDFEPEAVYDAVVLSHCSWYFKNPQDLLAYFHKIKLVAKRICFAEWDLDFTSITQRAHFCAASILALYSNLTEDDGNIQNLFHKKQIEVFLHDAGFEVIQNTVVNASYLQDGQWEQDYANSIRSDFSKAPPMLQVLANSYYELMNADAEHQSSLNSFVLCARPSN
ncbi:class I SAM-dependent methyltransferase [Paenibacillaceae bacterium]|nr:class I SAM-dependent methyltransferase [Paenibacillaceae bacterium]